jgi:hypothetical protein
MADASEGNLGPGRETIEYEAVEGWGKLPEGWEYHDVTGLGTDSEDRVYAFTRSPHPVIVFDREGRFLGSWGEGVIRRAHGLTVTDDDMVWLTDEGDHTVRKYTLDGGLLQTLGTPGQPSDSGYSGPSGPGCLLKIRRGGGPFHRPTKAAVAPSGDVYVTDGYGNAQVHRFSAAGALLQSWGEPGEGPGQFMLPHGLLVHPDGRVFVCDRENNRIQIFSPTGEFLTAWTDLMRPSGIALHGDLVFVGELYAAKGEVDMVGRTMSETRPSQVTVRDLAGKVLARWGGPDPFAPGGFTSAHELCVDSRGDLYVGEIDRQAGTRPGRHRGIQKFVRRR